MDRVSVFGPEHRDHVWSYDFVRCRSDAGKAFSALNFLDEQMRGCQASE
jgi:hypothetical protein